MSDNIDSIHNISIKQFGLEQSDILYRTFIFQKLCPGRFLIKDPWQYDELSDEEVEGVKDTLRQLMSLDTMVTDMWDWDIHFEDSTFEDCYFDVAFGPEDVALAQAEDLKNDILGWIEEYGMDYAQGEFEGDEFDEYILKHCRDFILRWRKNIFKHFVNNEKKTEKE